MPLTVLAEKTRQALGVGASSFEPISLDRYTRTLCDDAAAFSAWLAQYARDTQPLTVQLQAFVEATVAAAAACPLPSLYSERYDTHELRPLPRSSPPSLLRHLFATGPARTPAAVHGAQPLGELLGPIQQWQAAYEEAQARLASLDKLRLRVDAQRRRVERRAREFMALYARQHPGQQQRVQAAADAAAAAAAEAEAEAEAEAAASRARGSDEPGEPSQARRRSREAARAHESAQAEADEVWAAAVLSREGERGLLAAHEMVEREMQPLLSSFAKEEMQLSMLLGWLVEQAARLRAYLVHVAGGAPAFAPPPGLLQPLPAKLGSFGHHKHVQPLAAAPAGPASDAAPGTASSDSGSSRRNSSSAFASAAASAAPGTGPRLGTSFALPPTPAPSAASGLEPYQAAAAAAAAGQHQAPDQRAVQAMLQAGLAARAPPSLERSSLSRDSIAALHASQATATAAAAAATAAATAPLAAAVEAARSSSGGSSCATPTAAAATAAGSRTNSIGQALGEGTEEPASASSLPAASHAAPVGAASGGAHGSSALSRAVTKSSNSRSRDVAQAGEPQLAAGGAATQPAGSGAAAGSGEASARAERAPSHVGSGSSSSSSSSSGGLAYLRADQALVAALDPAALCGCSEAAGTREPEGAAAGGSKGSRIEPERRQLLARAAQLEAEAAQRRAAGEAARAEAATAESRAAQLEAQLGRDLPARRGALLQQQEARLGLGLALG